MALAAREHAAREHAVDEYAVADEVDLLDAGRAIGDAGAEKSACTGPPHSSTAASIDAGSARLSVDRLAPGEGDVGVVHHHDLCAGVLHQLGGRRAHAGGATDDEHALAVVPERVEQGS